MSPDYLVERFSATNGRIDGATATFGAPFYGQRLLGKLVYGESKTGQHYCTKEDYDVPEPDKKEVSYHEHARMRLLHIIVVRQGGCSAVTKARVAQEKGAHAVVVVDADDSKLTPEDIKQVIVGDDGFGKNVDIPSLLISKEEGKQLIEAVRGPEPVVVELAWDVPSDHVVLVDLWMSSGSQQSNLFLKTFAPHRRALNDAVKFVPHYHVFGLSEASYDYNDLCTDSTATYCAEDPDGAGHITGRMVLEEDLRQLCIHDVYKVRKKSSAASQHTVEYAKEYWDYVEGFHGMCSMAVTSDDPNHRFGEGCSKDLMKKVGIDPSLVDQCVQQEGEKKLQEQRSDVAWSPRALRINGWRFHGALEADLVTRAICAGFVHQPPACMQLVEPVSPFKVQPPSSSASGMSWRTLSISMLVVLGVVVGAGLLYKRSLTRHIQSALREEVMLEVQSQMDAYKELSS